MFMMQALVTALCWRPDGKQLAAGHANGSISILNVETGDIVSENKVHYAAIATLQWSDQATSAPAADTTSPSTSTSGGKLQLPAGQLLAPQHSMLPHQRFKRLFAPPELSPFQPDSTEPLPDPYDLAMEAAGAAAWPAERAGLSLLCAGDIRGHISLWLQGQVQVAEVAGGVHSSDDDDSAGEGPYQLVHVSDLLQICAAQCTWSWMKQLWGQGTDSSLRRSAMCLAELQVCWSLA
jgi:WD40 repeat protein